MLLCDISHLNIIVSFFCCILLTSFILKALQTAEHLQGERETAAALNLVLEDELFSEANGGRDNSARVLVTVLHGPSKNLDQSK